MRLIFIEVLFISAYFYNVRRGASHDSALGVAYASSSLTISFLFLSIGGLVSFLLGSSEIYDNYVLFSGGLTLLYIYVIANIALTIYFKFVVKMPDAIAEYESDLMIKERAGLIHILPLSVFGLLSLTFAFLV